MEVTTEVTTTQESKLWSTTTEVQLTEIMFQCSIKGPVVHLRCRDLMKIDYHINKRTKIQDQRLSPTKIKIWT